YSTGVVLFEMVTGRRPAGRELPSDLAPELPSWCDQIFEKLYARRRRRAESAAAVRSLLEVSPSSSGTPRRAAARVTPLQPPTQPTFSREEARRILGLSDADLDDHIASGRIRAHRVAGEARLSVGDVQELRRHRDRRPRPSTPHRRGCGRSKRRFKPNRACFPGARAVAHVPQRRRSHSVNRPSGEPRPAGFWIRALAMTIDFWVIVMIQSVIGAPFLFLAGLFLPQFLFLTFLYFTIGACQGQTLGKWCLGIRVIGREGRPPSIFEGVTRTMLYGLSAIPLGLGFVVAGWNSRRLALHDVASATRVVHVARSGRADPTDREESRYRSAI
ncbi:MAG: RDD family protein, partial [Planctomycetota bacterium]